MKGTLFGLAVIVVFAIGAASIALLSGEGSLKGRLTLKGVYAVCKPEGAEAVCFINKDSGDIACLPLTAVQNKDGSVCQ